MLFVLMLLVQGVDATTAAADVMGGVGGALGAIGVAAGAHALSLRLTLLRLHSQRTNRLCGSSVQR